MRLIPIECVKENSILGKNIYGYDGRVLLKSGCILTKSLIDKVKDLHIFSLYIIDEYSSIEIEDVIKPELRQKAISIIKETFTDIERVANVHKFEKKLYKDYTKKEQLYFDSIDILAEELISEILNSKDVLLSLVDIKNMDNYTYAHCVNVAVISLVLGISLNLSKRNLKYLCIGALLHDIGKSFVPKDILQKPSKLTDDEFEIIKQHPRNGYEFLNKTYNFSSHIKLIILQHHERFDGLGYPNQLHGHEITLLARIVSVADVYDALTSDRPYKRALCPSDAVEYLMSNAGTIFDFDVVNIFSKVIIPYPAGTIVSLSNGDIGIVKETLPNFPLRPIIEIIKSNNENAIGSVINLIEKLSIVISNIQYKV
ncbi:MAG: HD-GYP domain-containing protein [Clostridium butyricum]|nr:HD-GYP domain-containing protein [Clostridium butyricum]